MTLKNEDRYLFGTKVYDYNKKSISLIIKNWDNTFWENGGKTVDIKYATCVDTDGNRYNTKFENLSPYEEFTDEELKELKIKGNEV